MNKIMFIGMLCTPFIANTQSTFNTLRKLEKMVSVELTFESNSAHLEENSVDQFYSVVGQLYSAKEVVVAHEPGLFSESKWGAQRKQWFFDLLRQEHIEILSEKVYPFVPSGSSANVVIYFTPKKEGEKLQYKLDSMLVNQHGWQVTCLTEDLPVYVETRFHHYLDPCQELLGKITTTSSDGDFLKLHSVLEVVMPVGSFTHRPWEVKVVNDESKSQEKLFLYVLSDQTGEWILFSPEPIKQKKNGKIYSMEFEIEESGMYALASKRKNHQKENTYFYKEHCTILQATLLDPRGEFVGPAVVTDNRRFIFLPKVDYPEDTYVLFEIQDLDSKVMQEQLSVATLTMLQKDWYRVYAALNERWEERKRGQEEQVISVNQ